MTTQGDETKPKPVGIFVTLESIYLTVMAMDKKVDTALETKTLVDKLREEMSAMKSQLAAHAVVHGIMILVIGALSVKVLTGG